VSSAIVIGAGPAGLAVAAMSKAAGVETVVVDKAAEVGSSWRNHYERLHLHTARRLSGLPGLPLPRRYGRWVARNHVADYLQDYARHHGLELKLGTAVERIEPRGEQWAAVTGNGDLLARSVVIATGYNHTPWHPEWPGRFAGELLHASRYRNAAPYRGKAVLVAGTGNTGAEIAVDLVEGGASQVWLSARTPPNIVPRSFAGVPTQALAILLRPLPAAVVDPICAGFQRMTLGNLQPHFGRPPRGLYTQVLRDRTLPILDVGLVELVRRGAVKVVRGVAGFDGAEVLLGGGARVRPEVVIAATGYRCGLEKMVGQLGVLDAQGRPAKELPGLHFAGYQIVISGVLREIGKEARRIARAVAQRG
jgi:putative flavoprotein involved in K+ transport